MEAACISANSMSICILHAASMITRSTGKEDIADPSALTLTKTRKKVLQRALNNNIILKPEESKADQATSESPVTIS